MQGILPTVIAVAIFAKLLRFSIPESSNIKKYVVAVVGVCITAIMLGPILEFVSFIERGAEITIEIPSSDESDFESIFEGSISDSLTPSVEEYIYKELDNSFGINSKDCELYIEFETDGDVIMISNISMILREGARLKDTAKIKRYFEDIFLCPVNISIDIG